MSSAPTTLRKCRVGRADQRPYLCYARLPFPPGRWLELGLGGQFPRDRSLHAPRHPCTALRSTSTLTTARISKGGPRRIAGLPEESPLAPANWWRRNLITSRRRDFWLGLASSSPTAFRTIRNPSTSRVLPDPTRALRQALADLYIRQAFHPAGCDESRDDGTSKRCSRPRGEAITHWPVSSSWPAWPGLRSTTRRHTPAKGWKAALRVKFRCESQPRPEAYAGLGCAPLLMEDREKRRVRECAITLDKRPMFPRTRPAIW